MRERECLKSVETIKIEHNLLYMNQLLWCNSPRSQKMLAWRERKRGWTGQSFPSKPKKTIWSTLLKPSWNHFRPYTQGLYQSKKPHTDTISTFLESQALLTPLSEDHKEKMERPVTEEDVAKAISHMKANIAPGPDGYPTEFYKSFSAKITPIMTRTF